ncbi:hypothetical protein FB451DRAFT_1190076 [Mycena latifolia]|nr:hypothetical protein FB451DRAFT_1190076 [Mycena latifolia]
MAQGNRGLGRHGTGPSHLRVAVGYSGLRTKLNFKLQFKYTAHTRLHARNFQHDISCSAERSRIEINTGVLNASHAFHDHIARHRALAARSAARKFRFDFCVSREWGYTWRSRTIQDDICLHFTRIPRAAATRGAARELQLYCSAPRERGYTYSAAYKGFC